MFGNLGTRRKNGVSLISVRNKASPSGNDWLKLLWTDWFGNMSDIFILKQIVKMTIQFEKLRFDLTGFNNYFEHRLMQLH